MFLCELPVSSPTRFPSLSSSLPVLNTLKSKKTGVVQFVLTSRDVHLCGRWWRQAENPTDILTACLWGLLLPAAPGCCLWPFSPGVCGLWCCAPGRMDRWHSFLLQHLVFFFFCRMYSGLLETKRNYSGGVSGSKENKLPCILNIQLCWNFLYASGRRFGFGIRL